MSKLRNGSIMLAIVMVLTIIPYPSKAQSQEEDRFGIYNLEERNRVNQKAKEVENNFNDLEGLIEDKLNMGKEGLEKYSYNIDHSNQRILKKEIEKDYESFDQDREVRVSKSGEIKEISEAFEIASKNENIEKIIIEEGIYKESDLILIREESPIKIEGDGEVEIQGNMIFTNVDGGMTDVSVEGIDFNGSDNSSDLLGENIGIGGGNSSINLKNVSIRNYKNPIVVDSKNGLSYLNIEDSKIYNNRSALLSLNGSVKFSNVNYSGNSGGIVITGNDYNLEEDFSPNYEIKNSKFYNNNLSGPSLEEGILIFTSIDGLIEDVDIVDNTISNSGENSFNSILTCSGERLKIDKVDIKNNISKGSSSYDSIFYIRGIDARLSNINIEDNNIQSNILLASKLGLKNIREINQENNNKLNLVVHGEVDAEDIELEVNSPHDGYVSLIRDSDINLRNVSLNIGDGTKENIFLFYDSIISLQNQDLDTLGNSIVKIKDEVNRPFKVNSIKNLKWKNKNSKIGSPNKINIIADGGFYKVEDFEIDKESFHEDSMIEINGEVLGYKNLKLKNTGPFISKIGMGDSRDKDKNQFFMENIDIKNNIEIDQLYNFVPIGVIGQEGLNLKFKNIDIEGKGQIIEYLYLDKLDKVDIYQLKAWGHSVFSPLNYRRIKEINFYNSSLDNRDLKLSMYPNIDLESTNVNMYNTIFLMENPESKNIQNSIIRFKNSLISENLSEFDENFIHDKSNLIGEASLDSQAKPKKDFIGIDKGDNKYIAGINTDLAGKNRIVGDSVDIGAYEYQIKDNPIDPGPTDPEKPVEIKEHKAYIEGFKDGSVRPMGKLTRHEAAIVLYRAIEILDQEIIDKNYQEKADYKDIEKDHWGQEYIGTLTNIGIVNGLPDGNFSPGSNISRGEVAKMISYFVDSDLLLDKKVKFNDTKGHWAEEYIYKVAEIGWLKGYGDGSFKPNNPINRTELILIINRILEREVSLEDTLEGVKEFTDLDKSFKYYIDIIEATNNHKYKIEDGREVWVEIN